MTSKRTGYLLGAVAGAGIMAAAVAGAGVRLPSAHAGQALPGVTKVSTAPIFAPPPGAPLSFADIFERVSPAVVSINVTSRVDPDTLRQIVREQVKAGKSEAEVKAFLTDRYGEFVLLTPSFSAGNLVLWGGPFIVVLAGAALLFVRLRNRTPEPELTPLEAERLQALADDETA